MKAIKVMFHILLGLETRNVSHTWIRDLNLYDLVINSK
jgi:hypothetical protein